MMRSHWEKLGILGLVYGLVGRGFSNGEIAGILGVNEDKVRQCVRWLLRFEPHSSRAELALEALASIPTNHGRETPKRRFGFQPSQTSQLERLQTAGQNGGPMRSQIRPGMMLIREGLLLPDCAQTGSLAYSDSWRFLVAIDSSSLREKLATASQYLLIAGELKGMTFGHGETAVRRSLNKILAQSREHFLNCTEITKISTDRFLGIPYVMITGHSWHIQRGTLLQSMAEREADQNDRDWACQ